MKKMVIFLFFLQALSAQYQDKNIEEILKLPTKEIVERFKKRFKKSYATHLYQKALCSPNHYPTSYKLLLADYKRPEISGQQRANALRLLSEVFKEKIEDLSIEAFKDPSPYVRISAIKSLWPVLKDPKPETWQKR